jgi:hypothetical protein
MSVRPSLVDRLVIAVITVVVGCVLAPAAGAAGVAPGAPGASANWTTGNKQGLGTATTRDSKVWYTLSGGALSEVYFPRGGKGQRALARATSSTPRARRTPTGCGRPAIAPTWVTGRVPGRWR